MKNYARIVSFVILIMGTKLSAQSQINQMIFIENQPVFVSDQSIKKMHKNGELENLISVNADINDAITFGKQIWIGTNNGIYIYDVDSKLQTDSIFSKNKIVGLSLDSEGNPWVATAFDGVYKQMKDGSFEKKLNVLSNNCLVATADNNVYVGTNLGLYKISTKDNSVVRFAEEGYSGHGLPDNLVERLFSDEASNVWIMMPDNMAFQSANSNSEEIPTFSYVGNKDNEIYNILGLNNSAYLFVTKSGVVVLSDKKMSGHSHESEVFSTEDTPALALNNKQLFAPKDLEDEKILLAEKHKGEIYFYTNKGWWKIKESKLIKKIKMI